MKEVEINGLIIKVGDPVNIKNDELKGVVKGIKPTGYHEKNMRYNLLISWNEDPETLIPTRIDYFYEEMEVSVKIITVKR